MVPCRQRRERVVGRSEDRERSLAAQRVLEACRLDGGDERGEVAGGDRSVDDVGVCRRRCWRRHRRIRGRGRHGGGAVPVAGGIGVGAVVATGAGEDTERSESGDESKGSGGHDGLLRC